MVPVAYPTCLGLVVGAMQRSVAGVVMAVPQVPVRLVPQGYKQFPVTMH